MYVHLNIRYSVQDWNQKKESILSTRLDCVVMKLKTKADPLIECLLRFR